MRLIIMTAAAMAVVLSGCETKVENGQTAEAAKVAGEKTLLDGIGNDKTFAEAAKAAGIDTVLSGPSQYTVIVPSDEAFKKLPAGALDALMSEEGKQDLTALLSYHLLPGTMLAEDIGKAIDAGKGSAQIMTLGGGKITATRDGDTIVLTDASGGVARVTSADDKRSNGVIHHVDGVLMPKK